MIGLTYRIISLIVCVCFCGVWVWLSIEQRAMYSPPDSVALAVGAVFSGSLFKSRIDNAPTPPV